MQLGRDNGALLITLQEQKPVMTSEYAAECAELLQAFGERLQDTRSKQKEQNIFAMLLNVEPADAPDSVLTDLNLENQLQTKSSSHVFDIKRFTGQ